MSQNPKVTRPQNMEPEEIRELLRKAQVRPAQIAGEVDRTQVSIHQVIENKCTSHLIRAAIAKAARVDIKRIWPNPYLIYGGPRRPGRPACDVRKRAA
jgi:lambda repressor-like predicted transcriptional regulator